MKRHHYAPVTEATALEALELDAADAADYARYGTDADRADAATAADTFERARRGDWSAPSAAPRHRDTVRPVDSYSLAVDPYRAPRHLDTSATLSTHAHVFRTFPGADNGMCMDITCTASGAA